MTKEDGLCAVKASGIAQGVSIPSQEMAQRVLVEDDVEQPRTSAL